MNISSHLPGINAQECNCGSYDNYIEYFFLRLEVISCVWKGRQGGLLHFCGVFALTGFV